MPTDPGTGLTYIGVRAYDPATGQFISPDPVLKPADPQDFNAYVYGGANPIHNSDPTGRVYPDPGDLTDNGNNGTGGGDAGPGTLDHGQDGGGGCSLCGSPVTTPVNNVSRDDSDSGSVYVYVGAGLYVGKSDPRLKDFHNHYAQYWARWSDHSSFGAANFWSWYCSDNQSVCGPGMTTEFERLDITGAFGGDPLPGGGVLVNNGGSDPVSREGAIAIADAARDEMVSWLEENAGTQSQLNKVGLVIGAYSPTNKKVYLGWNISGKPGVCAEDDCAAQAEQDGVDPSSILFGNAYRPRTGEIIQPCDKCSGNYPGQLAGDIAGAGSAGAGSAVSQAEAQAEEEALIDDELAIDGE